ncbi:MAG: T9SS type A sorting domain-containing protein, partial [Ignavibacteriae bacterium]|nr:T9SS type A sorting domain-containing protein [Ignavibacteriota bacterium]
TALFPTASTDAFRYEGSYLPSTTIENGKGYWLKFNGEQVLSFEGTVITSQSIQLQQDWNMIGAISNSISVGSIVDTSGTVASNFYSFENGYQLASEIEPGKAYWVKASEPGFIQLVSGAFEKSSVNFSSLNLMNKVQISDAEGNSQSLYIGNKKNLHIPQSRFELPPVPPADLFDARFGSQYMVETYPDHLNADRRLEFPIIFQSISYPITIRWNTTNEENISLLLTDDKQGKYVGEHILTGSGKLVIKNSAVNKLKLIVSNGSSKPLEFSLSQNYPNPFNPSTRLSIEIPKMADVDVAVYDVLGRRIATLMYGTKNAGFYSVDWNGIDNAGFAVPTGTYLVRMKSEEFSTTRKILLLK